MRGGRVAHRRDRGYRPVAVSSDTFSFQSIGVVRSTWRQKLGTPRQAGLVPAALGTLRLTADLAPAARGLSAFSHVWLIFVFDRHVGGPAPLEVRPPRLGGARRVGVFASRAPYRPNPIGLSAVRLLGLDAEPDGAVTLRLGGLDLVDGTPILDVKPYLPYADALPDASAGWAEAPLPDLGVRFAPRAEAALTGRAELRALVRATLRLDPRPAHARLPEARTWATRLEDVDVRWRVDADGVCVDAIERAE